MIETAKEKEKTKGKTRVFVIEEDRISCVGPVREMNET